MNTPIVGSVTVIGSAPLLYTQMRALELPVIRKFAQGVTANTCGLWAPDLHTQGLLQTCLVDQRRDAADLGKAPGQ